MTAPGIGPPRLKASQARRPSRTTDATRTTKPAQTTEPTPTRTENAEPAQHAATTTTAPTATGSAVPAGSPAGDNGGLGPFGWLCLLLLPLAALAVALLFGRSRRSQPVPGQYPGDEPGPAGYPA